MRKITPFLYFDDQAEEAARFYTSVFKNSRIVEITRYTEAGPRPEGSVMTVTFELEGEEFIALNGGPEFTFSPAISLFVTCEKQEEIDELWEKLSQGGEEIQCGWLRDRYGVSWQICPTMLWELLHDPDRRKTQRVMRAMFGMVKLDIEALRRARDEEEG
jgi:predicted 3-demethylubiquinone-9 3-methyltransferase (glyoxalase superfamily)